MKKYFVFLLLIASCNGLIQPNNMIGNQDNRDGSDSDNRNTQSHPNGSVSGHNSKQAKILELCKKHIDQYFSSIRIEKSSDTKANIVTSLERITQLIWEDKDSLKDLGIPVQYSTLVDPLVQEYLVEKYNDLIQPESLSLLKKLNTEPEFNNINFIIDIINSIMDPNHKLFADLIINNGKVKKLMNNIYSYIIQIDSVPFLTFILRSKITECRIDRVRYVTKPKYSEGVGLDFDFESKPVLSTFIWAAINHSFNVLEVLIDRMFWWDCIGADLSVFVYHNHPGINMLTMALMCCYPDRDEPAREGLKTDTVSLILKTSLSCLGCLGDRSLRLPGNTILSDTIKFLLTDSNGKLPDLPKNATLLTKQAALDYLIKALANHPKIYDRSLRGTWFAGIECAIKHKAIKLFSALLRLCDDNKYSKKVDKLVKETKDPDIMEEFRKWRQLK
ncbi:hypothetical protein [Cardinium endosymbiont of Philonthus spinipes]|uniref:hypothetical protein n=1 Tax=Cardinium endosymbiont of Philonthus spinipes TaxID=3077941 RepID=UPI00313D111C